MVVTVPARHATVQIIQQIRAMAPWMPIIARGRYHAFVDEITEAGAEVVVDEEEHVGRRLGAAPVPWLSERST